jgi:hypothetical protein
MALFNRTSETYNTAVASPTAFAGGVANSRGDDGGTSDPYTLFTVSGIVAVKLIGYSTVLPVSAGGGTLAVGTAITPVGLLPATTASTMAVGEIWHDATVDASVELSSVMTEKIVTQNIIETVGTADITAGNVHYLCLWRPLSPNATVTPTNNV